MRREKSREFAVLFIFHHFFQGTGVSRTELLEDAQLQQQLFDDFFQSWEGIQADQRDEANRGEPLTKKERELGEKLILGALENERQVLAVLEKTSQGWKSSRMAKTDLAVLTWAIYEINYRQQTPPKIILSEAVDIAKKYGGENSGRFVNGLLDKVLRNEE